MPIRVLIVDDSIVMRKMLALMFSREQDMEVIGAAKSGEEAVAMTRSSRPDVVTLDVLMPGMDGIRTLEKIREFDKNVRIVMFSVSTSEKAAATKLALEKGADDWVAKPTRVREAAESLETIRQELLPKIRSGLRGPRRPSAGPAVPRRTEAAFPLRGYAPRVVAIGVSTGGPEALAVLLPELPEDFPIPVLVVQHMPEIFIHYLVKRLAGKCRMKVESATEGRLLEPGLVLIGAGERHLTVVQDREDVRVHLTEDPPVNSCRPSADVLFESAARVFGSRAVAVVMTGMGNDGVSGAGILHRAGALVIAQDEESSVVWGMPGGTTRAGFASLVLPPKGIAVELIRAARTRAAFAR